MNRRKSILSVLVFGSAVAGFLNRRTYVEEDRAFSNRSSCVANLHHIQMAKSVYANENGLPAGSVLPHAAVWGQMEGRIPRCPDGGTYTLNAVGQWPACSYTGIVRRLGGL